MSNVRSIVEALEDSAALVEVAKQADVTPAQARDVAAALGLLPVRQVIRILATVEADRVRRANRAVRKETQR